jgi:hypothetical protein
MNEAFTIWKKGNNLPVVTVMAEKVYESTMITFTMPMVVLWVQLVKLENMGQKTIYVCALRERSGAFLHTRTVELEAVLLYQEALHQIQESKDFVDYDDTRRKQPCRIDWDEFMREVPQDAPGLFTLGVKNACVMALSDKIDKAL